MLQNEQKLSLSHLYCQHTAVARAVAGCVFAVHLLCWWVMNVLNVSLVYIVLSEDLGWVADSGHRKTQLY